MHIGRISTRPVESCTVECSALELADRMRHAHVGDIVVIEYREGDAIPIGVVTDRDLVIEVMARGDDPGAVTAGQIMSRGLVVVSDTDEIGVALEEMRRSGIRRLPVVDDEGRLAGIVTLDDIVEHLAGLLGGVAEVGKLQQIEEQRFRA
ncbi:TPA: CBS domain-containing protein [Burkholderia aenigmatica]|uniref:CBS domain-containing protein n=1 Tax=Burkholderia sp. AU45251 TaxID=3059204 RepID=UPI00264C43B3|nr:CBS domain-containing protein [Burkholderia sp. AU45251]HDR9483017.1 CBS domain-containing protein [Burkholderia aenigmatica]MDN7515881.1 CBS domain-containing protein [Burkholderia sp. AU45251]HDR9513964.1 CBS domain-containing protein [Burkholderia aenigmatica]HDR9591355.1 CBS domain-containing protein [Burkholderia aenigmatica]HDR9598447.1 CBS domain-containing protein [Burkholderia aenigmatica]